MNVKRGEVYTVNLIERGTFGTEVGKKRPAIVIQSDIWNSRLSSTIIIPLTSRPPIYKSPTTITFETGQFGIHKKSFVLLPQLRAIDKSRLEKKIGQVPKEVLSEVEKAVSLILGLSPLE